MWTVGIDEVGYGPKLGPLVLAAAAAKGPLAAPVRIGDSKKVFSQARGVSSLEPAVLGFAGAPTLAALVERLGARLPAHPWYERRLDLPAAAPLRGLGGCWIHFADPDAFNAGTVDRNKSDYLFDAAAGLVERARAALPGPVRFVVGKQGGRRFYKAGIARRLSPEVRVIEERRARSAYEIPGATIEFLMDAEEQHELVALASMVGKYVRERAMELLNGFWAGRVPGLAPTAGYGSDAGRWFRQVEPALAPAGVDRDAVWRRR